MAALLADSGKAIVVLAVLREQLARFRQVTLPTMARRVLERIDAPALAKAKALCQQVGKNQPLDTPPRRLNPACQSWCAYFRPGVSAPAFTCLSQYMLAHDSHDPALVELATRAINRAASAGFHGYLSLLQPSSGDDAASE